MSGGYVRQLAASQVDGTHGGGVVVVVVVVGGGTLVQRGATVSHLTVETAGYCLGSVMSVWVHFWLVGS